jgi:negative regulator of flagellin synthesis FlgM
MASEINSISGSSIQTTADSSQITDRTSQTGTATTDNSTSTSGDRVSLTSSATQLQALEDQISSLPVVDAQRVEATQHALATGSHEVNPETTAEGMLEVERSFAQGS